MGAGAGAKININAGYFLQETFSTFHLKKSYAQDFYSITVFLHSLFKPLAGYKVLK